jgi:WD40 repeat protein
MTGGQAASSLTEHARLIDAGAHVVAAAFVGGAPALALADGAVLIGDPDEQKRVVAHPEACAWSAGKQVRARDETGTVKSWSAPSTVRGLAFQPKGFRLAATHYNGATLWYPKVEGAPQTLEWKGAHLDAVFSRDGRFLVTSMQENALHGWRLQDSRNMRMTGYPAKTRSLSWSHDGQWLATSGADAAVVWPFKDKDGPMGKAPRECGVRQARVTRVAFHPKALVIAIGYADGLVLLCRLGDAAEILARHPGDGPVSALAWDATGARLLFGLESGAAGLLSLPA